MHTEILAHLRILLADCYTLSNWDELLPITESIINSTIRKRTGVSGNIMYYGEDIALDSMTVGGTLDLDIAQNEYCMPPPGDLLHDIEALRKRLLRITAQHQARHFALRDKVIQRKNDDRPEYKAEIGEMVLYIPQPSLRGDKLSPPRKGPFRVLEHVNNEGKYRLYNPTEDKSFWCDRHNVYPF